MIGRLARFPGYLRFVIVLAGIDRLRWVKSRAFWPASLKIYASTFVTHVSRPIGFSRPLAMQELIQMLSSACRPPPSPV